MTSPQTETDQDSAALGEGDAEQRRLDLDVKVDSPSACQRHVRVTISREDIQRYFDEAVAEMMPAANIPGFRPGRAPRKLVEAHFRRELADQIKGNLVMDSVSQAAEEQGFSPISEPELDLEAVTIPDEGPLTFEFDVEVRPEFQLPDWKGLTLERPSMQLDDSAIDEQLQRLLERHGELESRRGPARVGDFLDLRLVFRHDGRVISELEESPIRLRAVLSFRDANLEGFDKLMQGAEAGEKRSARITLSEEAETKELRGEEVDVEIEVRDVKQIRLPELTREFLELLGNFENEGEFRSAVRAALERQLEYRQNQTIRQQIANLLTESAGWALPPELLQRQAERELQRAIMELRSSGFSDEQIRAHANTLRQDSRKATARALKEHFILERIAEDQGIEPDDQDYTMEISLMAHQSNESPRSIRARIEKRGLMDALRNQIVERKTIELIKSHARFKDTPLKLAEERTSAVDFAIGGARVTDIPEAKHGGDERGLPQPVDHT